MNETKKIGSKRENDTYHGMLYQHFWNVVSDYGFRVGFKRRLNPNTESKELILYHKEKGLILYAVFSDIGELIRLNISGEICYKKITDEILNLLISKFQSGNHFKQGNEWHWKFRMEGEYKVLSCLDEIYDNFDVCNPWSDNIGPKLLFITPMEETPNFQIKDEIISRKIKALLHNPNAKKIIGSFLEQRTL